MCVWGGAHLYQTFTWMCSNVGPQHDMPNQTSDFRLYTHSCWEPLRSTHLIHPFLTAMKKLSLTTKHHALGFLTDSWPCGFQSLNIAKLAMEHRGSFSDVPLVPMGPGFVDYVLGIVDADRAVRVVEVPGDDVEGVTELPCPPESLPSTQVEGALSAIEESV